jgi:hypothetical protein
VLPLYLGCLSYHEAHAHAKNSDRAVCLPTPTDPHHPRQTAHDVKGVRTRRLAEPTSPAGVAVHIRCWRECSSCTTACAVLHSWSRGCTSWEPSPAAAMAMHVRNICSVRCRLRYQSIVCSAVSTPCSLDRFRYPQSPGSPAELLLLLTAHMAGRTFCSSSCSSWCGSSCCSCCREMGSLRSVNLLRHGTFSVSLQLVGVQQLLTHQETGHAAADCPDVLDEAGGAQSRRLEGCAARLSRAHAACSGPVLCLVLCMLETVANYREASRAPI